MKQQTFQNVKFLVYRYNDLLTSGENTAIKIRHSQLTDDYLAAEEIQNQDWQYFIERILEVSNDPNAIESKETFLKTTNISKHFFLKITPIRYR